MKSELTTLMDLDVYTNQGRYVGKTEDVILDIKGKKASKLAIGNLNNALKEEFNNQNGILIPYRWVLSVGDIIISKKLPRDINLESKEEEEEESEEKSEEKTKKVDKEPRKRKKEGLFEY